MATRDRRWKQLYEAALNLGMKAEHAEFYATDAWQREANERYDREASTAHASGYLASDHH
jgi:hypothetical protein